MLMPKRVKWRKQQRGTVRLVARPEMMATNNQPARLQIGERVPQITVSVPSKLRLAATMTFSIIAFDMPIALIG